jgi:hypothetical protein
MMLVLMSVFFYEDSLLRMLFSLTLAWNDRFKPEKNFSFGLIMGFRANFFVVRRYECVLQGI